MGKYHTFDHRPSGTAQFHRWWAIFGMEKISICNSAILEKSTFMNPLSPNYLNKMVSLRKKCSQVTYWDHHFLPHSDISAQCFQPMPIGCPMWSRIKWMVSPFILTYIWYHLSTFAHKITITPMTDFEVFESLLHTFNGSFLFIIGL